jgi:hypothetical protein
MNSPVKRQGDLWALIAALVVLVATIIIAYSTDLLSGFRGSSLVYFGWALLATSAVLCGFLLTRGRGARQVVWRNVTLILGLAIVAFAAVVNVWLDRTMRVWPFS